MSCHHAEDVCQHCLEKVQTKDSTPPLKKSPPEKTITRDNKRNRILIDSAVLGVVGYVAYYNAKFFLKTFDYGVSVVKDILKNLLH